MSRSDIPLNGARAGPCAELRTEPRAEQLAERLRHAERLAVVGQLAASVAHDLNNVLLVIAASASFARSTLSADRAAREELAVIDGAVDQAARLVHQLLVLGRTQSPELAAIDVNDAVRRLEPLLRRLIGRRISLRLATAWPLRCARARQGDVEQVLVNLVANARDAMPDGGRIVIETADLRLAADAHRRPPVASGWYVRLTVRDTGVGMDDATRARAFEPFFTTKGPGRGTGLGLATVHRIATEAGGYVDVESAPGSGSAFTILLPAADDD